MRGVALLETLIAMTILVVAVLSLAQLLTLASRANIAAGQMTTATILAASKMEELRTLPWGDTAGADRVGAHTRRWTVGAFPADAMNAAIVDVRVEPGGVRFVALRARLAP
jgi:Tfp pilus assembly protein PilV